MKPERKHLIGPICATMVLLAVTSVYWYNEEQETAAKRDQAHDRAARIAHRLIAQRLERFELMLRGVKGYYESSESVDREEFKHYVEALRLDPVQVPLQGIAIALRIDHADKDRHTAATQRTVSGAYQIQPDGLRPQYTPIVLIEPLDATNEKALGFDVSTNPTALEALQRSLSTGEVVLTGSTTLAQDAGQNRPAVVMYLPLMAKDGKRVLGWVSGPFRIQDLMAAVASGMDRDVDLVIHDGITPSLANRVYGVAPADAAIPKVRLLEVGGRTWTLLIHTTPRFEARYADANHWFLALIGGVASMLLGFAYWQMETGRARATSKALAMTRELREQEAVRQATLDAIPDLLFEADAHGVILAYHAHRDDLLAAPPEVFMGKNFAEVLPAEATEICMAAIRQAAVEGYAAGAVYVLPLAQGDTWFEMSVSALPKTEGTVQRFVLLTRDITERRRFELIRQESEMQLRLVIRGGDIGFWDWDLRGNRLIVNERWCEMLGLDPKSLSLDIEVWNSRVHPDDAPKLVSLFAQVIQNPHGQGGEVEVRARHQAGHYVWILDRFSVVSRAADGTPLRAVGTHLDITERKKVELALKASNAQLQLLETCVSRLNDIVLITEAEPFSEPGPRIVFVNDAFVRRTGFTREEVIGKSPRMLQGPKTDRKELDRIRDALERWEPVRAELLNYTKTGEEFWIELDIVPVADASGWYTHWVAVERDVTERKQNHLALQAALRERTALLLEVHHRVKNNLQVINSLLRLESFRSMDAPTKSVLQDMQGRVRSMALLHETIYRKGTFAAIDLGSYVGQIASESLKSMQVNPGAVRLQLDMETLQVGLDQATPVGMLISELMSNSLKHAFPDGRTGEIGISLHPLPEPGQWRLQVSDSGIGLPPDFEERRKTSLGLQLAGDMATQMGGALQVGAGPRAVFTVDFKAQVPAALVINLDGVNP